MEHHTPSDDVRATLASLSAEVAALAAENASLRSRLDHLDGLVRLDRLDRLDRPDRVTGVPAAEGASPDEPGNDRRAFLRGGALAAGALASGVAASVVGAAPAAASNGDALALGETGNQATLPTALAADLGEVVGTKFGLAVADGAFDQNDVLPAAVVGIATETSLIVGVQGIASAEGPTLDGAGVQGLGIGEAAGVVAFAPKVGMASYSDGTALVAASSGRFGIEAGCGGDDGIGISVTGWKATMLLRGRNLFPPGETGAHEAGELIASFNEAAGRLSLWLCTVSGTPGTWRKLAGDESAGAFHVLPNTVRVYDSRPGNPPLTGDKTKLTGDGSPRTIAVGGSDDVQPGATAVLVNLTVVNTSAGGFVALHKGGTTWPGNSSINWTAPNTVIANSAVVAIDDARQIRATCAAGASTDLIIDVVGYYL